MKSADSQSQESPQASQPAKKENRTTRGPGTRPDQLGPRNEKSALSCLAPCVSACRPAPSQSLRRSKSTASISDLRSARTKRHTVARVGLQRER